jgi:D-alanyl-D-alanine carboxypeptidase
MTVTHADYQQRIESLHRELGIPPDYASRYGLAVYEEAVQLVDAGRDLFGRARQLTPETLAAWQAMQKAAASDGVTLHLISAFRDLQYQAGLIRRKLEKGHSLDEILQVSAAPGYSEHHTGRAIDVGTDDSTPLEVEFEQTAAFDWLCRCAGGFGFVLTYPRDNPGAIAYEPWHWCFHQK